MDAVKNADFDLFKNKVNEMDTEMKYLDHKFIPIIFSHGLTTSASHYSGYLI